MKKIIVSAIVGVFIFSTLVFAIPFCDKCKYRMTEIKVPIGQLYICRNCAGDVVIKVEIEDDTREKIDEKNRERRRNENSKKN